MALAKHVDFENDAATSFPSPVPAASTETLDLLRELVDEVRALRADLRSNSAHGHYLPPTSLSRADRALLGRLLPPIAGVFGPETFASRDLVEDAAPAVRLVVRGLSVKRISKLFARADGIPIDGLMVTKAGVECQALVWHVVAC